MKKVVYKIILFLLLFIFGIFLVIKLDSFFSRILEDIYKWSTNNAISFYGKGFPLHVPYFLFTYSIALSIFGLSNWGNSVKKIMLNALMFISFFLISLFLLCIIDANVQLLSCTSCDDGTLSIARGSYNFNPVLICNSILTLGLYFLYTLLIRKKSISKVED